MNRRFTSAQKKRLKEIQTERLNRANSQGPDEVSSGNAPQKGILVSHYSVAVIVEGEDKKLYTCTLRQNLGTLVTGDNVIWQAIDDTTGVVIACDPRRSVIIRPDRRITKPIAANVDVLVIVVSLSPLPEQTTIDRYLILANTLKIKALIVLSKFDLMATRNHEDLLNRLQVYEQLGFKFIKLSAKNKLGIETLRHELKDVTSILVGQSGVGKSSLLNMLVPNAKATTSALSQDAFGRHTTTASTLYHLPDGGHLIDSPGIRQFNLRHFTAEEILKTFNEFSPYLGKCQFRNCTHTKESNCALLNAVHENKIAAFRLENYHTILLDADPRANSPRRPNF